MTVTCAATDTHHVPCTIYPVICMATQQGGAEIRADDKAPTLTAAAGMSGNNQPVICLQGNGIDRSDNAGCNDKGWKEDTSYTLNTIDRPAVAYQDKVGSLCASDHKGIRNQDIDENKAVVQEMPRGSTHYIVRRLTPTECARLQGFADRWGDVDAVDHFSQKDYQFWMEVRNTHARINGKKEQEYTVKQMLTWYNKLQTDSSEYKMWGNGIALPTALYVLQGITDALTSAESEIEDWML